MKNEIGRKLTSLTIMAIMFAGGLTLAAPGMMPAVTANYGVSDGMLSVSSEFIQGASILEIVVNDPDISATGDDINSGATVSIGGTSYDMVQGVNGKWYLYVVDQSISSALDTDAKGMEFGVQCTNGMGTNQSANIIASGTTVWTEAVPNNSLPIADGTTSANAGADSTTSLGTAQVPDNANEGPGHCLDIDGMVGTKDTGTSTARSKLSASVLQDAPTLSDNDDTATDLGQRLHALNTTSGYGSWPYILAIEFTSDNIIEYGSNMVNVEFGNTDDEASITLANQNPAAYHEIHLTVTDPGLNLDPTFADIWIMDAAADSDSTSVLVFANNGTNPGLTEAERGEMQCNENCRLYNATGVLDTYVTGPDGAASGAGTITMTESGDATGVFESFDLNGESEVEVIEQAAADGVIVWDYAGETVDMIIAYADADLDFSTDGDWIPGHGVTVTITDPDMNFNPLSDETLDVGDEKRVIPTIVMGSPKTLADGSNHCLNGSMGKGSSGNQMSANLCGASHAPTAVQDGPGGFWTGGVNVGDNSGGNVYGLQVYNTTDNSKRLKIVHNGSCTGGCATGVTATWINVTTGHTRADIIGMAGTPYLSWDISGPAGLVSATDINVYVTDAGSNGSDNGTTGVITVIDSGAVTKGFADLDDGTQSVTDAAASWTGTSSGHGTVSGFTDTAATEIAGTSKVTVAFQLTHASGDGLTSTAAYAIAADFCSFDQDNASGTAHNCVYRLEAEETGNNTGVFEGTVEYITLNTATSGTGGHDGDHTQLDSAVTSGSDDQTVVLQDSVSGSDAIRLIYNDTDSAGSADALGKQLNTVTHTATASLDADDYEDADTATITIVDADLNQDSGIRDTYTNSTTTFRVTMTGSDNTSHEPFATNPMTIIETTNDSGIFVGTFTVPNYNGQDMELIYYEARDAGGNSMEFYDTATISSNAGSVSFDRSVYPVPFVAGDIEDGAGVDISSIAGAVTLTVTVSDADITDDTLTTGSTTGTISVKLIEAGSAGQECFTAGGTAASAFSGDVVEELGPLSEIVRDTSEFEVEFTLDKAQDCGASDITVSSGDVIQVAYTDASDDTGSSTTVYDSATFDLRTGSLSLDKDVYVLGSDMVVTLTDADLNLDAASTETYILDLIEWDSDADTSELLSSSNDFSNNPSSLQETGEDTGVFQTVTTLPSIGIFDGAGATKVDIDFGEAVTLTYNDQGLAGEDQVGDDELDIEAYFSISNFGALVELDKAVYSWTDVVYFTITAPDHNRNSASEEQIGTAALPIQITTRAGKLCTSTYLADESGPDTGVFEGEVELRGFTHTMSSGDSHAPAAKDCGNSSDGGTILTDSQTDGISVSFEYNDAEVVVASASIVWAIGEAYFDSSAVSIGGSGLISVVDEDENLDDDIIDTFTIDVYSDSDNGGFNLTMTETNEDTGVFEGTIWFTDSAATSGTNLRVSEGDTVTAEYTDETLPEPYTTSDDLVIAATTTVGTAFPPLERAPAANARVVDAFGASVAEVTVDQQVQIAADVSNGQDKDQAFAYLVQVQDGNGVTVSLAWITGSLTAGQSMSPALSWTPDASGSYTATVFVWESVDNPTALSPTVSVSIDVV